MTAPQFCQCPEPLRSDEDEEAFCWRCHHLIEATDDAGRRTGHAEEEDE